MAGSGRRPYTQGVKHRSWRLLPAVLAALSVRCVPAIKDAGGDTAEAAEGRSMLAEAVVAGWWPKSALAARRLLERNGVPDEVRPEELVWRGRGPWRRTVARNVTPPYVKAEDLGLVEQSVKLTLTPEQVKNLREFDRRVRYERGERELAARSDREEVNFLRMNLAHDVAKGFVTPAQARYLYERFLTLENMGKTSPYLSGLRFAPEP